MPREASITFEQVTLTAEAIKAEGGKPTSRAVRDRLGTGSMGTINKLLQDWKAGQERKIDQAIVLPAGLQRAILEFMDSELSSAKAKLIADLVEQQQETKDLAEENEKLEFFRERDAKLHADLMDHYQQATGQLAQVTKDLENTKAEVIRERQAAEQARTELAKAQLQLEALPRMEADLVRVRQDREQEHMGRMAAEKEAAVLKAEKAGLLQLIGAEKRPTPGKPAIPRARKATPEKV